MPLLTFFCVYLLRGGKQKKFPTSHPEFALWRGPGPQGQAQTNPEQKISCSHHKRGGIFKLSWSWFCHLKESEFHLFVLGIFGRGQKSKLYTRELVLLTWSMNEYWITDWTFHWSYHSVEKNIEHSLVEALINMAFLTFHIKLYRQTCCFLHA